MSSSVSCFCSRIVLGASVLLASCDAEDDAARALGTTGDGPFVLAGDVPAGVDLDEALAQVPPGGFGVVADPGTGEVATLVWPTSSAARVASPEFSVSTEASCPDCGDPTCASVFRSIDISLLHDSGVDEPAYTTQETSSFNFVSTGTQPDTFSADVGVRTDFTTVGALPACSPFGYFFDIIAPDTITIVESGGLRRYSDGTMASSCEEYIRPFPPRTYNGATGDGTYELDFDQNGASDATVTCDMTTDGGGWTQCYTAASGTFGFATWAMPGNSCFGGTAPRTGEMLFRGADSSAVWIEVTAGDTSDYASWCQSTSLISTIGITTPTTSTVSFWNGSACLVGGNNDVGAQPFYSWNHNCGGTSTLSVGITHGSGCDLEDYALGDLRVHYR